jgi:hypothetical protein
LRWLSAGITETTATAAAAAAAAQSTNRRAITARQTDRP